MDIDTTLDTPETSLGADVAKAFIISVASTAGTMVGMLAIGYTISKVKDVKAKRSAKKNQTEN